MSFDIKITEPDQIREQMNGEYYVGSGKIQGGIRKPKKESFACKIKLKIYRQKKFLANY